MSVASSPAPPREEDSTFTMDAFWADLGVDIPPPTGSRRESHGGDNNDDGGDMDIDEDDDFEL